MREVLYYPRFYIEDENWLKFALLYLGEVVTIIPNIAHIYRSHSQQLVYNETNLFSPHSPTSYEVEEANLEIGSIFYNPKGERYKFWSSVKSAPRDSVWEVFDGKLSEELREYLLINNLAEQSDNGLLIHQDLALRYMKILANIIAEDRKIPTITDYKEQKLSILRPFNQRNSSDFFTISNKVDIYLPHNIRDIGIEKIIEFRNKEKTISQLNQFHNAISRINSFNIIQSESEFKLVKQQLREAQKEYLFNLKDTFTSIGVSALGWYTLFQGNNEFIEYLRESLGLLILPSPRNAFVNRKKYVENRVAINYLSNIEKIRS